MVWLCIQLWIHTPDSTPIGFNHGAIKNSRNENFHNNKMKNCQFQTLEESKEGNSWIKNKILWRALCLINQRKAYQNTLHEGLVLLLLSQYFFSVAIVCFIVNILVWDRILLQIPRSFNCPRLSFYVYYLKSSLFRLYHLLYGLFSTLTALFFQWDQCNRGSWFDLEQRLLKRTLIFSVICSLGLSGNVTFNKI